MLLPASHVTYTVYYFTDLINNYVCMYVCLSSVERQYLWNACLHDHRAGQEDPCYHPRVFASFAQSVASQAMIFSHSQLELVGL